MKKVLIIIILTILAVTVVSGLFFYIAYERAISSPTYEELELKIECEDYRLASIEEWETLFGFKVNDNIARYNEGVSYDVTTQKVCMDSNSGKVCTEGCQKIGFEATSWLKDNEVGQIVCGCSKRIRENTFFDRRTLT